MREAAKIKEILSSPKNIAITTHHKPDADALGSSIGLSLFLKKKGHHVQVVTPSDYPKFLSWMPENELVQVCSNSTLSACEKTLMDADFIFCLDFNDPKRVYDLEKALLESKAKKILVDHHLEPVSFADYQYQDSSAAATCELIFEMIEEMGEKELVNTEMGECLYAGIMTDTGSFRFSSTSHKVHLIIAELIKIGVNNTKVHRLIYDNNTENRLRFLGYSLYNKLEILKEFKTAYFCITDEELKKFESQTGDTEGLVNYALSLEGIVMAVVMIERDDMVKISFRSAGDFSVREFAHQHFEGGGHKNASGGKSYLSLDETREKLLNLLPLYKNELINTSENN